MAPVTKKVDSKSRVTLPPEFADSMVIMEIGPTGECIIRLAEVVPKPTAWFWKNPAAQELVSRGLKDATEGKISDFVPSSNAPWLDDSGDE